MDELRLSEDLRRFEREVLNVDGRFVHEVVGASGYVYEVPKEIWDLVPSSQKRKLEAA